MVTEAKKIWSTSEITAIYEQPFNDLIHQAHTVHKMHHDSNSLQFATLLSIKTGAVPRIAVIVHKAATTILN